MDWLKILSQYPDMKGLLLIGGASGLPRTSLSAFCEAKKIHCVPLPAAVQPLCTCALRAQHLPQTDTVAVKCSGEAGAAPAKLIAYSISACMSRWGWLQLRE